MATNMRKKGPRTAALENARLREQVAEQDAEITRLNAVLVDMVAGYGKRVSELEQQVAAGRELTIAAEENRVAGYECGFGRFISALDTAKKVGLGE